MLVDKTCINCSVLFSRVVSKDREKRTKFCSKQCLGEWTARQRGWNGKSFDVVSYQREYQKEWREKNPEYQKKKWASENNQNWYKEYTQTEEYKLSRRTIRYKNRYGITEEDYNEMYKSQNGLCTICGNPPKIGQRLYVDHSHRTRKVRALLCQGCNSGLGQFKEDIKLLSSAIIYLEKFKEDD